MAGALTINVMDREVEVELMPLIFSCDSLPAKFSKRVRRPITELPVVPTPLTILSGLLNAGYIPDSDGEGDENDLHDNGASPHTSVPGTACKRTLAQYPAKASAPNKIRIVGGRAAVPKKVCVDLDSEDGLIRQMKDQGESNDAVRDRLIQRQGTRYDAKTIATRYSRILRATREVDEKRMEDEFSDYHENEDEHLVKAFDQTVDFFNKAVQDLEAQRWKKVADTLRMTIRKPKYSTKACRERVESLQQGTAIVPQELDAHPEKRSKEAAERVEERIRARAEVLEQARRKEEEKLRIKNEAIAVKVEEINKKLAKDAAIQAKKDAIMAERKAIADGRQAARTRTAAEKAADEQARRDAKEDAERQKRDEKAARAYEREHAKEARVALALHEKLAKIEHQRQARLDKLKEHEDTILARQIIRRTMRQAGINASAPLSKPSASTNGSSSKKQGKAGSGTKRAAPESDGDDEDEEIKAATSGPRKKTSVMVRPQSSALHQSSPFSVTSSPRNMMSTAGLLRVLKSRNMKQVGRKEDLVQRLAESDWSKSKDELHQMLLARKLKATGSKAEMAKRLAEHDAKTGGR